MWDNIDPMSIRAFVLLPLIVTEALTLLLAFSIFCISFIDIKVADVFITGE